MARKRAKIVIVEGPSDDTALSVYLSRYFDEKEIKFIELHSNVLAKEYKSPNNIITDLNNIIDEFLENNRYIKLTYIDEIVQIVDTDGMFVEDSEVIYDKNAVPNRYTLNNIYTDNAERIRYLNKIKTRNLENLLSKNDIVIRKYKIPYSVYYMSRNLEHVLHDRIDNVTDEEKEELSFQFANKYSNVSDFVSYIKESSFSVNINYKDSWSFIKKDTNSLKRYSNICLIL